jgi:hypothetical protein
VLQITTGKFFTQSAVRENSLRGVLYTNLRLEFMKDTAIDSPQFGRLVQTSELGSFPKMIVYEFTERLETPPDTPGVIVSHGSDSYLQDMAMLVSLFFNCTCSPDIDLARRLIGGLRGTATGENPQNLVQRVFDRELFLQPGESEKFTAFLNHILGLERKTYLGVMRAIRTYVTGLHRVADDFELAYTLMVAAAESLTQGFDNYTSDWESIPDKKRVPIEEALADAEPDVVHRVQNAIVGIEHLALGRRFQAFVQENVSTTYFDGPFPVDSFPPGKSDLSELLEGAYSARSGYIHELKRLPDMVTFGRSYVETILPTDSRQRMLTLQGLSRLIRNVIMNFALKQPTVEREVYDYTYELAGVSRVRLAASGWIASTSGDFENYGRDKLEGFLEQLVGVFTGVPDAAATDISEVLNLIVARATRMKVEKRRPYFALLLLFNHVAGSKAVPIPEKLGALMNADLKVPSSEVLLIISMLGGKIEFSREEHLQAFQNYKRRRGNKSGLRFPRFFEAAIGLSLAELYRQEGSFEQCLEIVRSVAYDFPENAHLREAIKHITQDSPVDLREMLTSSKGKPSTRPPHRRIKHSVRSFKAKRVHRR